MPDRTILLIGVQEEYRQQLLHQLQEMQYQWHAFRSFQEVLENPQILNVDILILQQQHYPVAEQSLFTQFSSRYPNQYRVLLPAEVSKSRKGHKPFPQELFDAHCALPETPGQTRAFFKQVDQILDLQSKSSQLLQQNQKQRHFLESMINSSNDAIVSIGQNFNIRFYNDTFKKLMQVSSEPLIGQNLRSYVSDGFKVLHDIYQQLTVGKKINGYRISVKPLQQEALEVNLSADFMYSVDGYVEGIILVMESLTLQDDVFHQLIREEKLDAIQHLANALAHEVQNPVNILSGRFQLLRKSLPDEKHAKSFDIINRQVDRISTIIAQLQYFNYHRDETVPGLFSPGEFLEGFLEQRKADSEISYRFKCQQSEKDILIQANRNQIYYAFTYLFRLIENLSNAKTRLNISCRLLKNPAQQRFLEIQIDVSKTAITEEILEPFTILPPSENYSVLDIALLHTIFSTYGGKMHMEYDSGGRQLLKLQFAVAGVKSLNTSMLKKTDISPK